MVEDEVKLSSFICSALREEGFTVDALHNRNEVEIAVKMTHFDVVVPENPSHLIPLTL